MMDFDERHHRGVDLNPLMTIEVLVRERHVTHTAHALGITKAAAGAALARPPRMLRPLQGQELRVSVLVRQPNRCTVESPPAEGSADLAIGAVPGPPESLHREELLSSGRAGLMAPAQEWDSSARHRKPTDAAEGAHAAGRSFGRISTVPQHSASQ